jgi:FkbM family methyltransferase
VAFDCGANVGVVTEPLAATGATVHAFEPDPLAFEALHARVGHLPNVHLHQACVGVSAGEATLMRDVAFEADPIHRTTRTTIVEGGSGMAATDMTVPVIDLLARLRETQVAFLKLDIEGAELDILEAMERDSLFDRVRMTVAETHPGKFPDLRPRFKALRSRLTASYPPSKVYLDWT